MTESTSKQDRLQLASPLYWPAWACLGLLWSINQLPFRWQIGIGAALGKFVYLFKSKLKTITLTNIKLCFPDYTPAKCDALAKKSFAELGMGLIEAGMAWWLPDEKLKAIYQIHGIENVDAAFAKGKGIILLGPHFTCLEMIARLLGMHYSFGVMYRPHKKKFIAYIHERFRQRKTIQHIPRHRMRELLRALNNNTAIWYAYDVDGGPKRSVFAPLFGIQTASLTAVSRVAELSGATVVPISFYRREKEFGYDIYLGDAIANFPTDDLVADATRLNASLEEAIRRKPEQYVWQYKRFKTRPPGEKRVY
jgi:KDO2-lipid IV(A) lauroyltransferase